MRAGRARALAPAASPPALRSAPALSTNAVDARSTLAAGSYGRHHPGSTEWQAHRAASAGAQDAAGTARSARSLPPRGTRRGKELPPPSGLHPMASPPVSEAGRLRGHCHRAERALAPGPRQAGRAAWRHASLPYPQSAVVRAPGSSC